MTQTAFYRNSSNAGTLPFTNRELTIDIFGTSTGMIIAQTDNAPYVNLSDWILCDLDDNLNLADYYPFNTEGKGKYSISAIYRMPATAAGSTKRGFYSL